MGANKRDYARVTYNNGVSNFISLSPFCEKREKETKGRERERREDGEIATRVNINCVGAHWRISQTRHFPLFREISWSERNGGVNEIVNYHPLNNGAVYEFRRHVAPARSLRPTEALGTATSLLNFPHGIARSERERERDEKRRGSTSQPRSSLN